MGGCTREIRAPVLINKAESAAQDLLWIQPLFHSQEADRHTFEASRENQLGGELDKHITHVCAYDPYSYFSESAIEGINLIGRRNRTVWTVVQYPSGAESPCLQPP